MDCWWISICCTLRRLFRISPAPPGRPLEPGPHLEQQVVLSALDGVPDEAAARALGVNLPNVKNAWLSIYAKIQDQGFLPDLWERPKADGSRGKQKRHRVVAFLWRHPGELRPHIR